MLTAKPYFNKIDPMFTIYVQKTKVFLKEKAKV